MGVQIQGAGRAAPDHVSRADSSKPLIHDSIHGQKYIQKGFLGKVGLSPRPGSLAKRGNGCLILARILMPVFSCVRVVAGRVRDVL